MFGADSDDEALDAVLALAKATSQSRSCSLFLKGETEGGKPSLESSDDDSLNYFDQIAQKVRRGDIDDLRAEQLSVSQIYPSMSPVEASELQEAINGDIDCAEAMVDELCLETAERSRDRDKSWSEIDEEDGEADDEDDAIVFDQEAVYDGPLCQETTESPHATLLPSKFFGSAPYSHALATSKRAKPERNSQSFVSNTARQTGDYGLKKYVYETRLMEMQTLSCSKRDTRPECKYGGNCVGMTTIDEICALRADYWGHAFQEAPSPKERKANIEQIFLRAHNQTENSFNFCIGKRLVCERGLLIALGIITHDSLPTKQWRDVRRDFQSGEYYRRLKESKLSGTVDKAERKKTLNSGVKGDKTRHAELFIEWLTEIFADSCPTDGSKKFLPYEKVTHLYQEYTAFCISQQISASRVAGKETFRKAFDGMASQIHLSRAKGSFPTCDICNNANDLLRGANGFNRTRREIIMKYKRCHLLQQAQERKHQEKTRLRAKTETNGGQPTLAYILIDGMTVMAGNTPKVGGGEHRHGKEDATFITNRIIGVEVACGPIDTVFFYHTDDTVGSGANTMIEVVRQAIGDLSDLLAKKSMVLPSELALQFDNCGENKNKYMFGYLSLLVESHQFEQIHVNFLIVGHTHTTIDQYFGVISDKIDKCKFIGSPIALWYLIETAHPEVEKRPTIQKQIFVVHNYKAYFEPYLNKVKYFQVPHTFRIRLMYGKAYTQYKLFSSHKTWLPVCPDSIPISDVPNTQVNEVQLVPMCTVGSKKELIDSLGLEGIGDNIQLSDLTANRETLNSLSLLSEMNVEIAALENKGIDQLIQRCEVEAEVGVLGSEERYTSSAKELLEVENYLRKHSSSQTSGFIMWLKSGDRSGNALQYILDVTPQPLISADMCEHLLNALPSQRAPSYTRVPGEDSDNESDSTEKQSRGALSSTGALIAKKFKCLERAAHAVFRNLRKTKFVISTKNQLVNARNVMHTREFKLVNAGTNLEVALTEVQLQEIMEESPNFTDYELTVSEVIFYKRISTVKGAIRRYLSELTSLPPFTLVGTAHLSEVQMEIIEQRKEYLRYEIQSNEELANRLLVKSKHNREDGEEILNAMMGRHVRQSSSQSQPPKPKCAVSGCNANATKECNQFPDCRCSGRKFCDTHGDSHDSHKDFNLKRQAIATQPPAITCSVVQCQNSPPYSAAADCPATAPCSQRLFCEVHRAGGHNSHYAQLLRDVQTAVVAKASDSGKCSIILCNYKAKMTCLDCRGLQYCGRHSRHNQHSNDRIKVPDAASETLVDELEMVEDEEDVEEALAETVDEAERQENAEAAKQQTNAEIQLEQQVFPTEQEKISTDKTERSDLHADGLDEGKRTETEKGDQCRAEEEVKTVADADAESETREANSMATKVIEVDETLLDKFEEAILKSEQGKTPGKRDYSARMLSEFNHNVYSTKLMGLAIHYGLDLGGIAGPFSNDLSRRTFLSVFTERYALKYGLAGFSDQTQDGRRKRRNDNR